MTEQDEREWPNPLKIDMNSIRSQYAEFAREEEEKLRTKCYSKLGEWIDEGRTVCSRAGIPLNQWLREALAGAKEDGHVRDTDYGTALRLNSGPDYLLFFVMLCPHARDDLLSGTQPPYPWRHPQQIAVRAVEGGEKTSNGQGRDSEPSDEKLNILEEGTGFWTITFRGKKLPAIRGREAFAYAAYVLSHPHEWLPALRVTEEVHEPESKPPQKETDQDNPKDEEMSLDKKGIKYKDSENKADRQYLEKCWRELSRLRAEQEKAKANGDEATAEVRQNRFDEIRTEVRKLTGPRGKFTKFANSVDKAFYAVRRDTERVRARVEKHSPELAQHLKNCIHFDKPCISYQPETPTEWQWVKPRDEKKT